MTETLILHATCIAVAGKAVLITGPSGSGKSALALQLIAIGGVLVADDRTVLSRRHDRIVATAPKAISGMIEARGVGLLHVPCQTSAAVTLVVDMSRVQTKRLPEPETMTVLDIPLPCLHKVDAPYFPAAIRAYIEGNGREA